jgi:hypothetical protein
MQSARVPRPFSRNEKKVVNEDWEEGIPALAKSNQTTESSYLVGELNPPFFRSLVNVLLAFALVGFTHATHTLSQLEGDGWQGQRP